jgi:lipoate-protein ligase B
LVFCQHPAVVTLGRGAQRGERPAVLDPSLEVIEVERGGLATYHGPGQIVAYPIFQLGRTAAPVARRGVVNLIRALEAWVIDYLGSEGVPALSVEGKTGVWVGGGERKIASIGLAARKWVSYHGIAVNFATGREVWRSFDPCGFSPEVMTDLQLESGRSYTFDLVRNGLLRRAHEFLS